MTLQVFLMVLGAALVHATWNALVKVDGDRLTLIAFMSAVQLVLSLCLVPFVAVPAVACWPYLLASAGLSAGYMLLLNRAYQVGDLSLVYPLARGVAPLAVAAVSVGILGEQLDRTAQAAVVLIALGIISLALTRGAGGLRDWRAVLLALGTGAFIAGYTVADGLGARAARSAHGYMVWVSLTAAPLIIGFAWLLQRGRRAPITPRGMRVGIAAGVMSYGSSWLVIWALTLAPLAMVSALRETGMVFAVLIGVLVLRERLNLARLASIAATLIGTAVLKSSR